MNCIVVRALSCAASRAKLSIAHEGRIQSAERAMPTHVGSTSTSRTFFQPDTCGLPGDLVKGDSYATPWHRCHPAPRAPEHRAVPQPGESTRKGLRVRR